MFFDNTGGPILDAVLGRIADRARVVLCGAISSYNDHHKPPGPPNYLNLISPPGQHGGLHLVGLVGPLGRDHRRPRRVGRDGRLKQRSHVFEGLDSAPEALNAMFLGENTGKVVIRVAGERVS